MPDIASTMAAKAGRSLYGLSVVLPNPDTDRYTTAGFTAETSS